MTHLVFAVEGYSDSLRKFEKDWHGKMYAGGKAKLRVREIKFYDFAVNECGRDEALADLKALCRSYEPKKLYSGLSIWKLSAYLLQFLGKFAGLRGVKDSEIKSPPVNRELTYFADKAVLAHFVFIGEFKDKHLKKDCAFGKKGDEIV